MGTPVTPGRHEAEDRSFAVASHLVELVSDGRTVLHAFEVEYSGATWEVVVRLRLPGGD